MATARRKYDSYEDFEALLHPRGLERWVLRLYVSGMTPQSARAISSVKRLCERHFAGRYELDVHDLCREPERARADDLLAAPTLVRVEPGPQLRLVGGLEDRQTVLSRLGVPPSSENLP
jgi:circadian clock protein KaiB